MQRPDLTNVDPRVIAYIEYLESIAGSRASSRSSRAAIYTSEPVELSPERAAEALPAEQENNAQIVTISRRGLAKRTLRHTYTRQHRGGMGVFGLDVDPTDEPAILANAGENQTLLIFTSRARAFRYALDNIPSTPVMGKGKLITERFSLEPDEKLVGALPVQATGYVAMVSENGRVRVLRHHLFGEHMRPGTELYKYGEYGPLAAVCWTPGDAHIFVVTQQGMGIRFAEKAISPQGDQGIKLAPGDRAVAITPVYDDSGVFLLGADGRGTVRLMSGFSANKSPGGSGKIAFKSKKVVGAAVVEPNDDLFVISQLGKIIRFPVDEVPTTEGVVQGVNCMGLRGDEAVSILKSGPIY